MRTFLGQFLIGCAFVSAALPQDAASQQDPSPRGAWSACQSWVKTALWDPEGLRFPAPAADRVRVSVEESPVGKPRYTVRSYAILPAEDGESQETIPFSCVIDYQSGLARGDGYVFRRITLPDSAISVPPRHTLVTTRATPEPEDLSQIIVSAVQHLRAEHAVFQGAAVAEPRSGPVAAALARASAMLRTTGVEVAAAGTAFSCEPGPCRLHGAQLVFRVSEPSVEGDRATLDVEVVRAMPQHEHRPYVARLFRNELVQDTDTWRVSDASLRVIT